MSFFGHHTLKLSLQLWQEKQTDIQSWLVLLKKLVLIFHQCILGIVAVQKQCLQVSVVWFFFIIKQPPDTNSILGDYLLGLRYFNFKLNFRLEISQGSQLEGLNWEPLTWKSYSTDYSSKISSMTLSKCINFVLL